jgi:hypothetical protein
MQDILSSILKTEMTSNEPFLSSLWCTAQNGGYSPYEKERRNNHDGIHPDARAANGEKKRGGAGTQGVCPEGG